MVSIDSPSIHSQIPITSRFQNSNTPYFPLVLLLLLPISLVHYNIIIYGIFIPNPINTHTLQLIHHSDTPSLPCALLHNHSAPLQSLSLYFLPPPPPPHLSLLHIYTTILFIYISPIILLSYHQLNLTFIKVT